MGKQENNIKYCEAAKALALIKQMTLHRNVEDLRRYALVKSRLEAVMTDYESELSRLAGEMEIEKRKKIAENEQIDAINIAIQKLADKESKVDFQTFQEYTLEEFTVFLSTHSLNTNDAELLLRVLVKEK